jgi:type IV secretion system protein VirB1
MTELIDFMQLSLVCAPAVHPETMRRLVRVESTFNPFAIGIVGRTLTRQPRQMEEALDVIASLERQGANYSVGLTQVNRKNFQAYGLDARAALTPCTNLRVGSQILTECFERARPRFESKQHALRAAFSCYESGNFRTGMRDGYVAKVVRREQPQTPAFFDLHSQAKGATLTSIRGKFSPR